LINLLALALLLTTFACSKDDEDNSISAQDLTVNIDENPVDGQVVGSVVATGNGTITFSISSQTPAGALSISPSTGELTVVDPNLFDFETNPVITATITIDNAASTATAIATINLNDLDEAIAQSLTTTIDENSVNGQVVGTIQATGGNLSFSITFQNPAGAFNIDASTGELTVADATLFDFETNPNMLATVSIENSVNMVSVNATINLNDLNEIGEFKYGGVIFWIDPTTNDAGLVCALNDQNPITGTPFGCSTLATGATGVAIGTGQANTTAIMAVCSEVGAAAYLATSLSANGYSDWFLPNEDEFHEIYLNNVAINASLTANGGINLSSAYYWTSTEFNSLNGKAKNPINGFLSFTGKFVLNKVRAIRAF
tara:strand:- start:8055 stop:9173 length:1119 start_codon:yes stop_codon:yes gene_type:complete